MTLRLGLADAGSVRKCIGLRKHMARMGIDLPLGEVMIREGALDQEQVNRVEDALGRKPDALPGFELFEKLGQGGMGSVYRARQIHMDRIVAVKILSSLLLDDPSYVQRFLREARSAARLRHPNIISAYDAGESRNTFYFVMEYVDGRSISTIWGERGLIPGPLLIDIAVQTTEALDYLHKHEMIHRDIKPDNLMLTRDGTLKICDFGLARSSAPRDPSLTMPGVTFGTPHYMSPEQINAVDDLDIRSDLYSLGATLYHLATGRPVFPGSCRADIMTRHLRERPFDPLRLNPALDPRMSRLILRLLEKNRETRFQTPAELLEEWKSVRSTPVPDPPISRITERHSQTGYGRLRRFGPSAAAAVVLLVLVYLLVDLGHGGRRPFPKEAGPVSRPSRPVEHQAGKPDGADLQPRIDDFDRGLNPEPRRAEAVQLMEAGKWKEAIDLLKSVGGEENRIRACHDEIVAGEALADWTRAMASRDWEAVRFLSRELSDRLGHTHTVHPVYESVRDSRTTAERELRAEEALARIFRLSDRNEWSALADAIGRFRKEHGTTEAGRAGSEALGAIRKRVEEHDRISAEASAAGELRRVRESFERLCREKKFAVAIGELQTFLRMHGGTEVYRKNAEDIRAQIERGWKGRKRHRRNESGILLRRARVALNRDKVWKAWMALNTLVTSYPETRPASDRQVAQALEYCRRELGFDKDTVLRLDFQKGERRWIGGSGAEATYIDETKRGRKSVQLRIPVGHSGDPVDLTTVLAAGEIKEARTVSFWIRTANRVITPVRFRIVSAGMIFESREVVAKKEWTRHELVISEFRPKDRPQERPDPARVVAFGFAQAERRNNTLVDVDMIVFRKR